MVFYSDSAFTTGNLEAQNSQNHQNIVVIYRLQTLNNVLTMSICCNRCFTTKEICRFSCSENKQEHKVYYRCSSPSLSQNKTCRPENEFYEILFGLFWTIISSNFPIELQLQFLLWDPLGPPKPDKLWGSSIRIQSGANGTFGAIKFRFQQGVSSLSKCASVLVFH